MAFPASVPSHQVYKIAGALSAVQLNTSGRPALIITTVGLPRATTAFTSSSCTPGNSIELRLFASPLISRASPTERITKSDCLAASTASANPLLSDSVIPHPFAYRSLVSSDTLAFTPSHKETIRVESSGQS